MDIVTTWERSGRFLPPRERWRVSTPDCLMKGEHSFMSLDVFKLDGRVALITGGNRGLGFAMAKALAEAGADVVLTSRKSEKARESAAAIAEATGRRALGLTAPLQRLQGDVLLASQLM